MQLRDKSLADVQREKLPNPMYLAWNDDRTDDQGAFKLSVMSMVLGGDKVIRPESLTSVKNFVKFAELIEEVSFIMKSCGEGFCSFSESYSLGSGTGFPDNSLALIELWGIQSFVLA